MNLDAGYEWLWLEGYPAEIDAMVKEYLDGEPAQPWPVLDADTLIEMWQEFMATQSVTDTQMLDACRDLVLRNVLRLQINTELAGHTERSAEQVLEEYADQLDDVQHFVSWAIDTAEGHWRISDYGLPRLLSLAAQLKQARTTPQKVMAIDAVLNVSHQRSDLASWFIDGGFATLNRLSA